MVFPLLRQQTPKKDGSPFLCLSDFIRPLSSGIPDTLGAFASSIDADMEGLYEQDPYKHLLVQTLSDRLAEAATEKCTSMWERSVGYAKDENLGMADLLVEKYQGIRPAVGYPSLPDQSVNFLLDELLDMKQIGISLTGKRGNVSSCIGVRPDVCTSCIRIFFLSERSEKTNSKTMPAAGEEVLKKCANSWQPICNSLHLRVIFLLFSRLTNQKSNPKIHERTNNRGKQPYWARVLVGYTRIWAVIYKVCYLYISSQRSAQRPLSGCSTEPLESLS